VNVHPTAAVLSFLIFAAIFVPLERLRAMRPRRLLRPALATDLLFLFGNFLLWTPLILVALLAMIHAIDLLPLAWLRVPFAAQPWWLQAIEGILLCDLGTYWFHRASHRVGALWRIHRVHHTAETVDWIAAYREHPLDNLLTRAVENLPLLLLGFPMPTIAGFVVFRGLWALFIHANTDLSPGPLRFLLGAPRLHHWHHEIEAGARCNFANLDPLMDLLFGTYWDPGHDPQRYGIAGEQPRGYVGLIVRP
jgi:sterol desaturase/sphingolipid hydroxylase (fatty acid hydroxylase superfamily)